MLKPAPENTISPSTLIEILLQLPVAVIISDNELKTLKMNSKFKQLFGYSAEDLPSVKEWWKKAYPDKRYRSFLQERWGNAVREADTSGEYSGSQECRITCSNGKIRYAQGCLVKVCGLYVTTFFDVTERKKAELELEKSRDFIKNIIENNAAAIFVKDAGGRYTLVNSKWIEITGMPEKDVTGKTDHELFSKEIADTFRENDLKVIAAKKTMLFEEVFNSENSENSERYYKSIKFVIRDNAGKITGICGIATDITETIEMAGALEDSERKYRQIYNDVQAGITKMSPDFIITSANATYCRMTGYTESELVGKKIAEITHPDDIGENLLKQKELKEGEIDIFTMEKRYIHKNGHTIYGILKACAVRNTGGEIEYYLGSVIDITEPHPKTSKSNFL